MNNLRTRINSAPPFTWQAFVWMGLGLLVFSPRILVNSVGYQPETWRGVLLLTLLIVAGVTFTLNALFMRKRTIGETPWISWSLVIGLSIVFPIIFRFVSLEIFALHQLQPGFIRFVTSSVLWLLGTLVFAVIVNETKEFKNELGRLRTQFSRAQRLEREEQSTLESLRNKMVFEIKKTLKKSFKTMMRNSSSTEYSAQLQVLLEDVVRPLSQKIASSPPDYSSENNLSDLGTSKLRVKIRDVAYRLSETNPFEYKVTPLIVAVSTLSVKTWVVPLLVAFQSLLANILFLFVTLAISHKVFARYAPRLNKQIALIGVVTTFLIISLLDTLVSRLVMRVEPSPGNLLITFIELGVMVLLALFRAVPLERKRLLRELDDLLVSINWMNSRRGQLIWLEQQRLARLVHGDIQAQILSTSLELSQGNHDAVEIGVLINQLQMQCDVALSSPTRTASLSEFLSSLTHLWAASVEIRSEISPESLALIGADPMAQDAVVEIIREALTNAVKHSKARKVSVVAQVSPLDTASSHELFSLVRVEVLSDVNAATRGRSSLSRRKQLNNVGHGTSIYEQLCAEWSLEVTTEMSQLVVWVPIATRDHTAH